MKRKASWLVESFEKTETKFDDVIALAVSHENELNENDLTSLNEFLDDMRDNGWYPFVSKIMESVDSIDTLEYVYSIPKDEHIFQLYMLEKEYKSLDGFGTIDVADVKQKIEYFKGCL
jgi:hypothetical protein